MKIVLKKSAAQLEDEGGRVELEIELATHNLELELMSSLFVEEALLFRAVITIKDAKMFESHTKENVVFFFISHTCNECKLILPVFVEAAKHINAITKFAVVDPEKMDEEEKNQSQM